MSNYNKAFRNLNKYSKEIQALVLELYNSISDLLKQLIIDNSIGLREAQRLLMNEFERAINSMDFIGSFSKETVSTIVDSSYVATLGGTRTKWADFLWRSSMFKDKVTLSARIRNNSANIIRDQKIILKRSLKEGKTIAQIVGNINQDNLEGFTRSLPDYIEELKKARIAGAKLTSRQISAVKAQATKLKTAGLRADYLRLIESIELDKNIDKAVYYAMERRTKYYAERLARTEAIATMNASDAHIALKDKNTRYVKSITRGSNPCPYCIAVESLGFVPVESATIPTHHPHCSCKAIFEKSLKKPERLTKEQYNSKMESALEKANRNAEKKGKPKTYLPIEQPRNLRTGDLLKNWKP